MFQFVIWGRGVRGTNLLHSIKSERVIAFIDNRDRDIGSDYEGKPVISFDAYMKEYRDYIVVVSPMNHSEIVEQLEYAGIRHYLLLTDECISFDQFIMMEQEGILPEGTQGGASFEGISLYGLLFYENFKCIIGHDTDLGFLCEDSGQKDLKAALNGQCRMYASLAELPKHIPLVLPLKKNTHIASYPDDIRVITANQLNEQQKFRGRNAIEKFRGIHHGQRCFIVATGPSLTSLDLDRLCQSQEICISMNGIFNIYEKTTWRPSYYAASDGIYIQKSGDEICNYSGYDKFLSDAYAPFWRKPRNSSCHRFHIIMESFGPEGPEFSNDFAVGAFSAFTVTYICLQLAVYMGFQEIYLFGVDFSAHNISGPIHFCDDKVYAHGITRDYIFSHDENLLGYLSAKRYAEANGIQIYNATRGGKLEVFERVDFDSLS